MFIALWTHHFSFSLNESWCYYLDLTVVETKLWRKAQQHLLNKYLLGAYYVLATRNIMISSIKAHSYLHGPYCPKARLQVSPKGNKQLVRDRLATESKSDLKTKTKSQV